MLMSVDQSNPIYVFIDESGNLDFSGKGTDHFVMSAFITADPLKCSQDVINLKYEFMKRGLSDQLPFHAVYNSDGTRKRFADALCEVDHICHVHTIYCDKHLAHPSKHADEKFYSLVAGALAKYIVKVASGRFSPIVLMFDSVLSNRHRKVFLSEIKPTLNAIGVEYRISFSPVKEEPCGQIADYYAWAQFRKLERGDSSWLERLQISHDTFNLFQNGHTRYW